MTNAPPDPPIYPPEGNPYPAPTAQPVHAPVDPNLPVDKRAVGVDRKGRVRRTRSSAVWVGLIGAAIVLVALLIFIGQNSGSVTIHYLGARGRVSLAIALLLSAVAGLLLIAIPGTIRILQLRRLVKMNASRPPPGGL